MGRAAFKEAPCSFPSLEATMRGGDGQPAGVGGRGRRGAAGAGSTKKLWERKEQGNDEGHVIQWKLKCRGGGKEKRSRQAEIWKSHPRRTVLKTAGNACMPFSAFFSRSACFLPEEEMTLCAQERACWVDGLRRGENVCTVV